MNVFDQAARYSIQSDPLGFLRWILRGINQALKFYGWLDTRTLPVPRHARTGPATRWPTPPRTYPTAGGLRS